jgi:hypothetical protein
LIETILREKKQKSFVKKFKWNKMKGYKTFKLLISLTIIALLVANIGLKQPCFSVTTTQTTNKHYYEACDFENATLSTILATYRAFNAPNRPMSPANVIPIDSQQDILFNKTTYCDARNGGLSSRNRFYQPRLIINNKNRCKRDNKSSSTPFLAFLVHSANANHVRRKQLRETWLSQSEFRVKNTTLKIVHMFVVGSGDSKSDELITKEAAENGDMLMIDARDSYANLIYKYLAIFDWVEMHCANALFVVKIDDDIFVNTRAFLENLRSEIGIEYAKKEEFMYCQVHDHYLDSLVSRDNDNKL